MEPGIDEDELFQFSFSSDDGAYIVSERGTDDWKGTQLFDSLPCYE